MFCRFQSYHHRCADSLKSKLKYCSTLKIILVHFKEDFENFILELCFFITKYVLQCFSFYRPLSIWTSPEPSIQLDKDTKISAVILALGLSLFLSCSQPFLLSFFLSVSLSNFLFLFKNIYPFLVMKPKSYKKLNKLLR